MSEQSGFEHLKSRQRAERNDYSSDFGLRIHRAISWLRPAEAALEGGDLDNAFVCYWIAFNAAYAGDLETDETPSSRDEFRRYFASLLKADSKQRIYDAIWTKFSGPVRMLLDNRFTFAPFWTAQRGGDPEAWKPAFQRAGDVVRTALSKQDTQRVLEIVFDRLYVLRNQVMHGGATWNGQVNRDQLRDAVAIQATTVPLFIQLMMDEPADDWGMPFYPVMSD